MPPRVSTIPVPRFQELKSLRGDWPAIADAIEDLKAKDSSAWLEIIYEGDEIIGNLRDRLDEVVIGSNLKILPIKNTRLLQLALKSMDTQETLDDLDVTDVFNRCLEAHEVPEDQRPGLLNAYREVIVSLHEEDTMEK